MFISYPVTLLILGLFFWQISWKCTPPPHYNRVLLGPVNLVTWLVWKDSVHDGQLWPCHHWMSHVIKCSICQGQAACLVPFEQYAFLWCRRRWSPHLDLINSTVISFPILWPILHFGSHSGELNEDMTGTNFLPSLCLWVWHHMCQFTYWNHAWWLDKSVSPAFTNKVILRSAFLRGT